LSLIHRSRTSIILVSAVEWYNFTRQEVSGGQERMVKALFIFTSLRGCGCLKSRFPIVREKRSIPNNRKWLGIGSWDSVKPLKRVIGSKAIKLPFLVFLDRYMTDIVAHTRRPKTIESYDYLIRLNVKPELGNVKLTVLRPDHLQNLYSLKLNQRLSKRTVQYIHA